MIAFRARSGARSRTRALSSLAVVSAAAIAATSACREGRGASQRDKLEDIYGLRTLPSFDIELGPAARDKLAAAPREWVQATFRYQGETWAPVGVRLKGHRSLRRLDQKPSFKIDFDRFEKGRRFLGLRGLTLNAMVEDPTMMRESLGYRLYREVGVPAPETGYAELRVDGEPYGVYLLVETVDQEFVEDHFGTKAGAIYEGEYGCDLYAEDVAGFEKDLGEDDRSDLADLVRAADLLAPAELMAGDRARFDESALSYLAVSALIGDFDGYRHSHNYRLYRHPSTARWSFIPWGIDRVFFKRLEPYDSNGRVAERCFRDRACRLAYLAALRRVLDRFQRLQLDKGVDFLTAFLAPAVAVDRRRPYNASRMERARRKLRGFLRTRAGDFARELSCLNGAREVDRDGDGYGCMDCDDSDREVRPDRADVCGNQVDDDCSGMVDDSPTCPCPTVSAEGATFALCDRPMSWREAAAHCAAAGGALARIDSAAQSAAVYEAARGHDRRSRWWIGLHDAAQEGRYEWSDATPVTYTGWADGQPDNGSCNQDCAGLKRDGGGSWQDTHCGQDLPFVCRMP